MAAVAFHHGARVFQSGDEPVLIRLGDTSVIGLLATAPDADEDIWPVNTPVLITNPSQAASLGEDGTAQDALDSIFDQGITKVVVVRIDEGGDADDLLANAIGSQSGLTGIHAFRKCQSLSLPKPKLLLAPGIGSASYISGIASVAVTNGGSGYTEAPDAEITGGGGTGAKLAATIDTEGAVDSVVVINPGYGYSAGAGKASGEITFTAQPAPDTTVTIAGTVVTFKASGATGNQVNIGGSLALTLTALASFLNGSADAGLASVDYVATATKLQLEAHTAGAAGNDITFATNVSGASPTSGTLDDGYNALAVAFSGGSGANAAATPTAGNTMNPVVAEAIGVAEKLRAVFYADGPDGTDAQALQMRSLIGSRRILVVDPRVLKSVDGDNVPKPSSPVWAGLQAKRDRERGPHWPGSNMGIAGIVGTNRAVNYGDQANYLNENRVNTIINLGDGFRAWGVWTCAQESIWQFVNVVRVHDAVNEAIERAFIEFNDRPMTRANLDFMVWSGLAALKNFENEQMLLPGSVFRLADGNTPTTGAAGIAKFLMAYEVPAPMVDIQIDAYRNIQVGYTLLFNSVTGEVAVG